MIKWLYDWLAERRARRELLAAQRAFWKELLNAQARMDRAAHRRAQLRADMDRARKEDT